MAFFQRFLNSHRPSSQDDPHQFFTVTDFPFLLGCKEICYPKCCEDHFALHQKHGKCCIEHYKEHHVKYCDGIPYNFSQEIISYQQQLNYQQEHIAYLEQQLAYRQQPVYQVVPIAPVPVYVPIHVHVPIHVPVHVPVPLYIECHYNNQDEQHDEKLDEQTDEKLDEQHDEKLDEHQNEHQDEIQQKPQWNEVVKTPQKQSITPRVDSKPKSTPVILHQPVIKSKYVPVISHQHIKKSKLQQPNIKLVEKISALKIEVIEDDEPESESESEEDEDIPIVPPKKQIDKKVSEEEEQKLLDDMILTNQKELSAAEEKLKKFKSRLVYSSDNITHANYKLYLRQIMTRIMCDYMTGRINDSGVFTLLTTNQTLKQAYSFLDTDQAWRDTEPFFNTSEPLEYRIQMLLANWEKAKNMKFDMRPELIKKWLVELEYYSQLLKIANNPNEYSLIHSDMTLYNLGCLTKIINSNNPNHNHFTIVQKWMTQQIKKNKGIDVCCRCWKDLAQFKKTKELCDECSLYVCSLQCYYEHKSECNIFF